jgi:hypothetical protein
VVSTNGHALDSKQVHKQLHDDSDSFSGISQNADIDIIGHSDPDAEVSGPDLSDGGNSYDGQAYVDGGDSDEHSNEDWAL